MLKMSFYNGTLDKERLKKFIGETNKPIRYTHGLKYRNPTIMDILISKEESLKIINQESFIDVVEHEEYIDLNTYSGNDLW